MSSAPLIRLLFFATFCFQFLTSLKRYFCGLVYVELRCLTLFRDMAATFKVAYLPLGCYCLLGDGSLKVLTVAF